MDSFPKKILIADKQYLIARSLGELVREKLDMMVLDIVSSRSDLERTLALGTLSLLIIDINHFDFERIAELKRILSLNSSLAVLILTNTLTRDKLTELNSIGIKNIVLKSAGEEELITAIDHTLQGKKYYGREVLEIMMETGDWKKAAQDTYLTGAEIEIVKLIADGKTTKEIAMKKHVSFHTIMTHRKNIFRKVKVNNASELVMVAFRTGLIDIVDYQI